MRGVKREIVWKKGWSQEGGVGNERGGEKKREGGWEKKKGGRGRANSTHVSDPDHDIDCKIDGIGAMK